MKRYTALTAALAAAIAVQAQGLHQEIEVEREIVPVERQAQRHNMLPAITLPALSQSRLSFSDRVVATSVNPSFSPLSPVSPAAPDYGDYRGYVNLGIFPVYNARLSAGYRILDTDRTRLAAWLQYDGRVYRHDIPSTDDRRYWRDNAVTVGADLRQAVGEKSFIDATAGYSYSRYTMWNGLPSLSEASIYNQWTNRFDVAARFSSKVEGLTYSGALKFDRFSYGMKDADCAGQNLFGLDLDGSLAVGEGSDIALGVDASLLHSAVGDASDNTGLITLKPRYEYNGEDHVFSARVGAVLDISVNDGKVFRIAPDVMAAWNPSPSFGIELSATGGTRLNTLASLYDVTPYSNPFFWYGNSSVPVDATLRAVIGPFRGIYAELWGGYAKADDWLMPAGASTLAGNGSFFVPGDISGWRAGIKAGWNSRYASVSASYETTESSADKGYYLNRDRARHVLEAEAAVRPLDGLEISLNYSLRACRAVYDYTTFDISDGMPVTAPMRRNLHNASLLGVKASYAVSKTVSIYITGENLLNRDYLYIGDRPAQGITGLVGFDIKF